MIFNKTLIENIECKMIFLIKGMRQSEIKAIPRKYKNELYQLKKELQKNIPLKEYRKFLANCLDIKSRGSVDQAEDIIKEFHKEFK